MPRTHNKKYDYKKIFLDDGHPSTYGNKLIAETIYKNLFKSKHISQLNIESKIFTFSKLVICTPSEVTF